MVIDVDNYYLVCEILTTEVSRIQVIDCHCCACVQTVNVLQTVTQWCGEFSSWGCIRFSLYAEQ